MPERYLHGAQSLLLGGGHERQSAQATAAAGDFRSFRDEICQRRRAEWLRPLAVDPRETVPVALAIFALAEGDVERSIACAAGLAAQAMPSELLPAR